jgi:hypothetical protein
MYPLPNVSSNLLTVLIGAAALVLALAFIQTHKRSEHIKEWLVGAAAGLDFAQITHVHLFTIATIFWLLTSRDTMPRKVSGATVWLLVAAGFLAATTFVGPLILDYTLALQLIGLATIAAIIGIKATPQARKHMAYGLLSICLFSACWAILQKFGFLPIHAFNAFEGTSRVTGIYREPDWLGLFCAVGIVTTLRLDLARTLKATFLAVLGFALLFSLARASIIALAITGVLAVGANLLTQSDAKRRSRNRQVLAVVGGVVVGVLVLSPGLSDRIITRFQTGFSSTTQDVAARARTRQVESLSLLARNAPWYGDGLSAAGRVDVNGFISYGSTPVSKAVSTNWVLGWWVDGKYLALPLIMIFCLLALRFVNRLGGQLLVVVLVTSLASNASMLPITWFAIGLCLAYSADAKSNEARMGLLSSARDDELMLA